MVKARCASVCLHRAIANSNREEATGTRANRVPSDEPSNIVIRVPSIIVITLTVVFSQKQYHFFSHAGTG